MAENAVITLEVDVSQAEKGIVKVTKNLTDLKKTAGEISNMFTSTFEPLLEGLEKTVEKMVELTETITTASQLLEGYFEQLSTTSPTENLSGSAEEITGVVELLGATIEGCIGAVASAITGALLPVIGKAVTDFIGGLSIGTGGTAALVVAIMAVVAAIVLLALNWDEYGGQLTESFSNFVSGAAEIWSFLDNSIIRPVIENVGQIFDNLMQKHLKPLWDYLCLAANSIGDSLLAIWETVIEPFVKWCCDIFAPMIISVIDGMMGVISVAAGFVGDVIHAIVLILDGVIQFVAGVFSKDWSKAWEGVLKIVEGVGKGFGALIRGAINIIIMAINSFIRMLYSVLAGIVNTAGGIVQAIGYIVGQDWGFSVSANPPQIPYLAQGAVLPANKPFLAVVGDQKHGTNVEAPLETIQQALANVLASHGPGDIRITFAGDLAQLGRVLKPVIDRENRRFGGSLITKGV